MTPPGSVARWALRVLLDGRPVEIDAAADARVGDLLDATGAAAVRGPDGALLVADALLSGVGIRHGDALELVGVDGDGDGDGRGTERGAERGVVELVCAELHARWTLPVGRHAVGRRAGNAVAIGHESVSRAHATIVVRDDPDGPEVVVTDDGSTNGTFVGGHEVRGPYRHEGPGTVRFGDVEVELRPVSRHHGTAHRSPVHHDAVAGWIEVPRPPRRSHGVSPVLLDGPELPADVARPRLGWLSALAPMVLAVVVVVVSVVVVPGSLDGAYLWLTVAFLMMSPLMSLAGHVEARRGWRRDRRRERARFDADLAELSAAVDAALAEEVRHRLEAHPAPDAARRRAEQVDERLWEGPPEGCHVALRLGAAPGTSSVTVDVERSGMRSARERVEEIAARARRLDDAPLVVATPCTVGIVGPAAATAEVAACLLLAAATNVAPSRRTVDVVAADGAASRWEWLRWLDASGPRRGRVRWRTTGDVGPLTAEVGGGAVEPGRLHLVIAEADALHPGDAAALTAAAAAGGATLVWRAGHRTALPAACDVVVEVADDPDEPSRVTFPAEGSTVAGRVDRVSAATGERWARALAPLTEVVPAAALAGSVPDEVDLAAVVGRGVVLGEGRAVTQRWRRPPDGVRIALGCDADGPVRLDLRRAGPHAIVAGTTGSGKSELLRTLVVSAAVNHPPDRLQLLLVDYKGGAAFGACAGLPHVAGVVTDLDDGLAARVVVSLRAELRRREELLAASGHASLADAEVGGGAPFPNLLVVVDEFASIAAEVPDFLDGVVDLARRGRSLGMHLVLATQRPTGVVSDHLRANASLRIALRVADPQDSMDVVGVADAAAFRVDRPGRAVLRVGDEAPTVLQVAHCGARRPSPPPRPSGRRVRRRRPVVVRPSSVVAGATAAVEPSRGSAVDPTDLERVVASLVAAHRERGVAPPPPPWLPPLPEVVELLPMLDRVERAPCVAVLGLGDEPQRQARRDVLVDLPATGPLAVVGAAAWAGDVVRSVAVSLVAGRAPSTVRLDVIDGSAGRRWSAASSFPQLGSVVPVDDHERVRRVLTQLERRCRSGGRTDGSRVLVVDNVGALVASAERSDPSIVDALARVVADGTAAGVHVVVSADRRGAVPPAVWSAVGAMAVGAMASVEEFDACAFGEARPPAVPGRVVFDGIEVQCASVDEATIRRVASADHDRFGDAAAPPIGRLPAVVAFDDVVALDRGRGDADGGRVLVGVDDEDLGPFSLDLAAGNVVVAGPVGSGRSTALSAIAAGLWHATGNRSAAVLVSGRATSSPPPGRWRQVLAGAGATDVVDAMASTRTEFTRRWAPGDPVVFVDDATDLDDGLDAALDRLAAAMVDGPLRFVVAVEASVARQAYGGLVARMRRGRRAILLHPDVDLDGDLAGVRLPRRGPAALPPGRGEWVDRGAVRRVQVAHLGPSGASGASGAAVDG